MPVWTFLGGRFGFSYTHEGQYHVLDIPGPFLFSEQDHVLDMLQKVLAALEVPV